MRFIALFCVAGIKPAGTHSGVSDGPVSHHGFRIDALQCAVSVHDPIDDPHRRSRTQLTCRLEVDEPPTAPRNIRSRHV